MKLVELFKLNVLNQKVLFLNESRCVCGFGFVCGRLNLNPTNQRGETTTKGEKRRPTNDGRRLTFMRARKSSFFDNTQLSTSADPQLAFTSKGYNTRVLKLYKVSHRNCVYLSVP